MNSNARGGGEEIALSTARPLARLPVDRHLTDNENFVAGNNGEAGMNLLTTVGAGAVGAGVGRAVRVEWAVHVQHVCRSMRQTGPNGGRHCVTVPVATPDSETTVNGSIFERCRDHTDVDDHERAAHVINAAFALTDLINGIVASDDPVVHGRNNDVAGFILLTVAALGHAVL